MPDIGTEIETVALLIHKFSGKTFEKYHWDGKPKTNRINKEKQRKKLNLDLS